MWKTKGPCVLQKTSCTSRALEPSAWEIPFSNAVCMESWCHIPQEVIHLRLQLRSSIPGHSTFSALFVLWTQRKLTVSQELWKRITNAAINTVVRVASHERSGFFTWGMWSYSIPMDTESTSICVSFFYQTLARSSFTLGNAFCHRKTVDQNIAVDSDTFYIAEPFGAFNFYNGVIQSKACAPKWNVEYCHSCQLDIFPNVCVCLPAAAGSDTKRKARSFFSTPQFFFSNAEKVK